MDNIIKKSANSKSRVAIKIIVAILALALALTAVFFLYDSPASYVPDSNGNIYLNSDGKPFLYYTDLFGNTFVSENGKRIYTAVPVFVETQAEGSAAVS